MRDAAPRIKSGAPVLGGVVVVGVEEYERLAVGLTTKAKSAGQETGATWK